MRLYQLVYPDLLGRWEAELAVEVVGTLGFGFAAAVGKEDEGDVVFCEVVERGGCPGNGLGGAQKDAVDVEGECEVGYPGVGGL